MAEPTIATNAITATALLKVARGEYDVQVNKSNKTFNQFGKNADSRVQTIGTSGPQDISIISDVATNGWAMFINLSTNTSHWVDIGTTNGSYWAFSRLQAREFAVLPLHPTNSLSAQAYGAEVNLQIWVNER